MSPGWWTRFLEVFVPIFVALTPLSVLPFFLSMTEGMGIAQSRSIARRAVLTAFFAALLIVVLGQAIFRFLAITLNDLRVAGGVILLVISTYDLILAQEHRKMVDLSEESGVVPLGIPIIFGPATMTACMVLADSHGRLWVALALSINLALIALMLYYAERIKNILRPSITRAFGKVMALFLAAIAVSMLRAGLHGLLKG